MRFYFWEAGADCLLFLPVYYRVVGLLMFAPQLFSTTNIHHNPTLRPVIFFVLEFAAISTNVLIALGAGVQSAFVFQPLKTV